mmetsp:Transcript_10914/g.19283  ORF Transcript_10914/g.19283 Transcript_10914/m.19283 type:complete len:205 (+) Transcript_10914:221-835(+)
MEMGNAESSDKPAGEAPEVPPAPPSNAPNAPNTPKPLPKLDVESMGGIYDKATCLSIRSASNTEEALGIVASLVYVRVGQFIANVVMFSIAASATVFLSKNAKRWMISVGIISALACLAFIVEGYLLTQRKTGAVRFSTATVPYDIVAGLCAFSAFSAGATVQVGGLADGGLGVANFLAFCLAVSHAWCFPLSKSMQSAVQYID